MNDKTVRICGLSAQQFLTTDDIEKFVMEFHDESSRPADSTPSSIAFCFVNLELDFTRGKK